MGIVLFTGKILNGARANLHGGYQVRDAAVDLGGYHFESGVRDFEIWSRIVGAELSLALAGSNLTAEVRDLVDVYVRMRERAFELAKDASKSNRANLQEISESLNAFMKISRPSTPARQSARSSVKTPESVTVMPNRGPELPQLGRPLGLRNREQGLPQANVDRSDKPLERLLQELRTHIGLEGVKREITELVNLMKYEAMLRSRGKKPADRSLHMVFYGNPGTGKTTVARLVAQIYRELGLLTNGGLVCTDRSELVAKYVGQTAPRVTAKVQEALGGVLFIDEAYSLAPPNSQNDFGQEAIQQLVLLMENHRKDLVVIVAGYPDEMTRFLEANPGLNSRFTKKLHFEDYTSKELVEIFEKMCSESEYLLNEESRAKLMETVQAAHGRRDRTFGNARFARNLFEETTKNLANRIVTSNHWDDSTIMLITAEDIPKVPVMGASAGPKRLFPDLGKYLASTGCAQKTALIYHAWEIEDLAITKRGHYSTTRIQPLDANLYCATFDFGDDILNQILRRAPVATRAFVGRELAEDPLSVRTFHLPEPVNLGIMANLGTLQQGLHDTFIPLVIREVFGADPSATVDRLAAGLSSGELSDNDLGEDRSFEDTTGLSERSDRSLQVNPEITETDVKAIKALCRQLAREWWRTESRRVAICDACNNPVLQGEGFLNASHLICDDCFRPNTAPQTVLTALREDPDCFGEGLLDEARRFVGMRPRR